MFKLPTYQELSTEQDSAFNLPVKGNHLIVGPPGSGKTVVAIYRAEMLRNANASAQFIVFNNTLNQYLDSVLQQRKLENMTSTFHKWFPSWYRSSTHEEPPRIDQFTFDWNAIFRSIGSNFESFTRYPNLIIDEGQDFPREFYRVMRLLVENLTVFADENQRINESNSTIDDISQALGIQNLYYLHKNYRNSRPIAEFASYFYTGLRSGIPDLPERDGVKPRLFHLSRQQQINLISNYANNNPTKTIGVMVYSKQDLKSLYDDLLIRIKNPVEMYYAELKGFNKIHFHVSGVKLVTYASAKGLEFDTVFLPLLDHVRTDARIDDLKMKFYVLVSRAREELFLLSDGDRIPPIMSHIPKTLYEYIKVRNR